MNYNMFMNGLKKAGIEVEPKDPRRSRRARSGGVYRARRQGALRVERSVSRLARQLDGGSATSVVAAAVVVLPRRPVDRVDRVHREQ